MSSEVSAVEKVLQVYFDGLYEGDTKKLGEAFHPASHLYAAGGDGKASDWPRVTTTVAPQAHTLTAKIRWSGRKTRHLSAEEQGRSGRTASSREVSHRRTGRIPVVESPRTCRDHREVFPDYYNTWPRPPP